MRSRPGSPGTGPGTRRKSERHPGRTCHRAPPPARWRPGAPMPGVLAAEAAPRLRLRRLQPHQPLSPALDRRLDRQPNRLGHAPVADEHPRPSDQLLTLLARAATERARTRRPVHDLPAPTPPPGRLGGLLGDLVDPLVPQAQRLCDLPQRPTRCMQPSDREVVVGPRPLGGMLGHGQPLLGGLGLMRQPGSSPMCLVSLDGLRLSSPAWRIVAFGAGRPLGSRSRKWS
jgi:hypothetical protein